jgi:hypothetical protein
MKVPQARPAYRVPRGQIDELYQKDTPPEPPRPAVGTVTLVSGSDRTIEVDDAGETITVVALGTKPAVGQQIDYYLLDGLAFTPEPSVGAGGQVFVQPDDPGLTDPSVYVTGQLWFDTDEPVS